MKRIIRFTGRGLIVILIALVIALITTEISGEIFTNQYMAQYHITSRTDLAEDYGFGMEGLGQVLATFIISFPISIGIIWFLFWQFRWKNQALTHHSSGTPNGAP